MIVTGSKSEDPLLTDEDRTLLEHWKAIYPRSTLSNAECHSTVAGSGCSSETTPTKGTCSPPVNQPACSTTIGHHDHMPANHMGPSSLWSASGVPPACHLLPSLVAGARCMQSATAGPHTTLDSTSVACLLAQPGNGVPPPPTAHVGNCGAEVLTSSNLLECGRGHQRRSEGVDGWHGSGSQLPPTYNEAVHTLMPNVTAMLSSKDVNATSTARSVPPEIQLGHNTGVMGLAGWTYDSQQQIDGRSGVDGVPSGWVCEETTGDGKMISDLSGWMYGCAAGKPADDESTASVISPLTAGRCLSRVTSEELRVITSRLVKSHMDDLTLRHTPRGSGAGYGVGVCVPSHFELVTSSSSSSPSFAAAANLASSTSGQDGSADTVLFLLMAIFTIFQRHITLV